MMIGTLAIAGIPPLSGFFSKDEILFRTFWGGHRLLWTVGVVTSLLTATYMFRLVYMTFFGEPRYQDVVAQAAHGHGHGADAHGHGGHVHLHDAPPAMAIPLVILAIGSVLAGYVGVPHALGGQNRIEAFLEPSFHPAAAAWSVHRGDYSSGPAVQVHPAEGEGAAREAAPADQAATHLEPAPAEPAAAHGQATGARGEAGGHGEEPGKTQVELTLMAVSSAIAFLGIGIAWFFFRRRAERAEAVARALPGVHRLLLNKYYVDEIYDATIIQPIKRTSETVLWKGVDAGLIDGVVNGAGTTVRGTASLLRLLQTGSVRAYAASIFVGVLLVLAFYLAR
jgi:NADH-quinone oxidoreductase subunit L